MQNKVIDKRGLHRYFGDVSIYKLIDILQNGQKQGYFNIELLFKDENQNDNDDLAKLINHMPLTHDEPYVGALNPNRTILPASIQLGAALSKREVRRVIDTMPKDLLTEHLRFRLSDINYEELKKITRPKNAKDYDRIEHDGLVTQGLDVFYLGTSIKMTIRELETLRVFMGRYGQWVDYDTFFENRGIFKPSKNYDDPQATLGKLVYDVHKKLQEAVGRPCIFNKQKNGWRLEIK